MFEAMDQLKRLAEDLTPLSGPYELPDHLIVGRLDYPVHQRIMPRIFRKRVSASYTASAVSEGMPNICTEVDPV